MTPFKVWRENTENISQNIVKLSRFFSKDTIEFEKHLKDLAHSSDKWLQFLKDTQKELKVIKKYWGTTAFASVAKAHIDEIESLFTAEDGEITPLYMLIDILKWVIHDAEHTAVKWSQKKTPFGVGLTMSYDPF